MIRKTIFTPCLLLILLSASFLELRAQNSIHEEKIREVYSYLGKEDTIGINKAIDLYAKFSKTIDDSLKLILSKELISHLSETANFNWGKKPQFYRNFHASNFARRKVHLSWKNTHDSLLIDQNEKISYDLTDNKSDRLVILFAPLGYEDDIFSEFVSYMVLNNFRVLTFNYPGLNSHPQLPWPEQRDFSMQQWITTICDQLNSMLEGYAFNNIILVGVLDGFYISLRFAERFPKDITHLIAINGMIHHFMPSDKNNEVSATLEERTAIVNRVFPKEIFDSGTVISPDLWSYIDVSVKKEYSDKYNYGPLGGYVPRGLQAYSRYQNEFKTDDILKRDLDISIPILSILSNHDTYSNSHNFDIKAQWEKFEIEKKKNRVTTIPIAGRDFPFLDRPDYITHLMASFINDELIPFNNSKAEIGGLNNLTVKYNTPYKPSHRANSSRIFGTTKIGINYSSPRKAGRNLETTLIPYNEIWRAGANQATIFYASNDVVIKDNYLPAGKYALFIKPINDSNWTIIFNRISKQWGSFQYDATYDALRIIVRPEYLSQHSEYLRYTFTQTQREQVEVNLRFGSIYLSFPVREVSKNSFIPKKLTQDNWKLLISDKKNDGRFPYRNDGKSLSYFYEALSDTIWFKFNVYGQINQNAIAVNILFDTDLNQNNGQRWYGTNRKYHFDIAATLWVRYERTKYQGIVGITDSEGARKQNWNKLIQDNISFYVDHENDSYLVGVKKTDIAKDLNTFNVIGTIGEYYWWNDDIGDSDYATISLDE